MKKYITVFRIPLMGVLVFINCLVNAQNDPSSTQDQKSTFPKGQKAPQTNFTGTAWVHGLIEADSAFNIPVASVTFEPGARTNRVGGPMAYSRRWPGTDRN